MIMDEVKEEFVKELLKNNKRSDGRGLLEYRPIKIEKGLLPNAEGSCLAQIGDTKVLAGVKFDVVEPYKDRPAEGVFQVNAEFLPLAHPEFFAGPPDERSIELARVVDRGIRSADCVDSKKLFLEEGKALGIYVDLYIMDHSGNLIDTAGLAAMGALLDTKVPKYEAKALIRGEFSGKLHLERSAVVCSFEKIDGKIVLDANDEEEVASEGRLSFATCDGDLLCAAQKSGRSAFSREEFSAIMDASLEKGRELRKLIGG
ncbi:exosome complex protein Rrp42 [Candidatus Micrarchaeota archaeon]|nr:exosome complex protein Rrp42 [Candidatus Micrarchaeota archaeon]